MECLLFTVCVMSGARSVSKQGMGKTERHPAMLRLFGRRGGISVWRWNPDQTIPPVADQVAGSSAMQAECDTLSILCFLVLCCVTEETCGYCSLLGQVFLWEGQKVAVSIRRGAVEVMTESSQRAMHHHPGMRQTDTHLKENLKIIFCCGCKSVTLPPSRDEEVEGCWRRNVASPAFQKSPAAVSQAAVYHQSCRGLFHVEQIACPDRPVDCLLLSVGGVEAVTSVRPPEDLDWTGHSLHQTHSALC